MVIPLIFKVALPLLVNVIVCAALLVPTVCEAKVRLAGARVTAGAVAAAPVPVKATDCGLPLASSAMDTEAVRVPVAVGLNVTLMLQLAAAARVAPQVLVSL